MAYPNSSNGSSRALVVGAGFGGLAVALRLLARGYDVHLLEKHTDLGGRARTFELDGHRFDAGPTVITAPFLFSELFERFGERVEDHVTFLPVSPFYRMDFADGSCFDYGDTTDAIIAEIERLSPGEGEQYHAFLEAAESMYQRGFVELATRPFTRVTDMLDVIPDLVRLRADRSIYQFVSRFFRDERLRRAFSVPSLLVGGNPFRTSSLYALIHALERKGGVWYAKGGTGALVDALAALFQRHGGRLHAGQSVERLEMDGLRVQAAVTAEGQRFDADLVVSNADPLYVYNHWIARTAGQRLADSHRKRLKHSMGLFVLYFTTDRVYSELEHHTIVFGETFREILEQLFDRHELPQDLSLYLHRPGATDPSMAPDQGDAFYVLAPVPNLQGNQDWSTLSPVLEQRIVAILSQRLMSDLPQTIRATRSISPRYFHEALNTPHGSGFSIAPTLTQSAGLRFHNQSPRYDNLFFVGAGVHPGAGVPGVVSSAAVVERLVDRWQGQTHQAHASRPSTVPPESG
ncbi:MULTISPECIES: phytoene desaturase family protein [Halomonadaceae]|uniref:Phytoene desaturase n=1 Tax=Vreelandella halophila TaxID=86177 RepID=A0A9X4Y8B6_9GAMM|nr:MULTISPECIES: phytoene desaturase family protein [Halomonas]MYL25324.1 phytoene desaturase [Halomonas utahensis]MYL75203.1 phytoene desaturase [Halomonas sp. 22501_18_FS]